MVHQPIGDEAIDLPVVQFTRVQVEVAEVAFEPAAADGQRIGVRRNLAGDALPEQAFRFAVDIQLGAARKRVVVGLHVRPHPRRNSRGIAHGGAVLLHELATHRLSIHASMREPPFHNLPRNVRTPDGHNARARVRRLHTRRVVRPNRGTVLVKGDRIPLSVYGEGEMNPLRVGRDVVGSAVHGLVFILFTNN